MAVAVAAVVAAVATAGAAMGRVAVGSCGSRCGSGRGCADFWWQVAVAMAVGLTVAMAMWLGPAAPARLRPQLKSRPTGVRF